jgi:hypothetical protein
MSSSRKFNMDQFICIVQKTNIKNDAIFSSLLKTCGSRDRLGGYQSTFQEYVESLRNDNQDDKQCDGRVHVSLDKSVVCSLWDEVQGVIEYQMLLLQAFFPYLVLRMEMDYQHVLPALTSRRI